MRVAVIGSGYVGLVAAACYAELGHEVICVDNSTEKIAALNAGETPIHEEFLPELLSRHRVERLHFTTSVAEAVRASSVIFVAVGTPPAENGEADLSSVEEVSREIALSLKSIRLVQSPHRQPDHPNFPQDRSYHRRLRRESR